MALFGSNWDEDGGGCSCPKYNYIINHDRKFFRLDSNESWEGILRRFHRSSKITTLFQFLDNNYTLVEIVVQVID